MIHSTYHTPRIARSTEDEVAWTNKPSARPTWDDTWMDVVTAMAKRSTCARRAVGCVIVSADNKLLTTGYNGVQSKAPHCNADHPCVGANAASGTALDDCRAVHAEQNALWRCKEPELMFTAYVSVSPCYSCTQLMLNTPIQRIVFAEPYAHDEKARRLWTILTHPKYCRVWEQYRLRERLIGSE